MSGEGLALSVIIFILGIVWLALPMVRRSSSGSAVRRQMEREALLASYERTLSAIRDLDEDYSVGKLTWVDYEFERSRWMERGAGILQEMEKIGVQNAVKDGSRATRPDNQDRELDAEIERAIAKYAKSTR